ncbi:MAG: pimeloyl-CoA dehydrogenase large subunit [Rhodospirillaceae bacterium]|nr:pimeloyl-CoA dehydrogenase large subunit [Rhodospirillaceae bacterium]
MNLNYTPEEEAFRQEVRTFLKDKLPSELAKKTRTGLKLAKEDFKTWQRLLYDQGWVSPKWPEEHGGTGWTAIQLHIFDEECFAAGAPRVLPFGIGLVGPVLTHFGNDEQKATYLDDIRSGEVFWCQGFSEPGSGSDLASLKTRAVLNGDKYIVNGQKTWTTAAHWADWMFTLVRTDPDVKQQEGISFLLIDMKSPGISVRPIITIDGEHMVNEVFIEDVEVPAENLVGEVNKGWGYAKFLLANERTGIAGIGQSKDEFRQLKEIAKTERKNGKPLIEDPLFQSRLAKLEIDLMALEITNMRMLVAEQKAGKPGPMSSILKIRGTEIQQQLAELSMDAVGVYANPWIEAALEANWNGEPIGPEYAAAKTPYYMFRRKASIYGGSNEIQKNVLTKAVLEL